MATMVLASSFGELSCLGPQLLCHAQQPRGRRFREPRQGVPSTGVGWRWKKHLIHPGSIYEKSIYNLLKKLLSLKNAKVSSTQVACVDWAGNSIGKCFDKK